MWHPIEKAKKNTQKLLTHRKKRREEEKDAAREQGSGPPEERVGKDTGEKKISASSSSATRDARARFLSLLKAFLCSSVSSERKKTCARDRGLKIC